MLEWLTNGELFIIDDLYITYGVSWFNHLNVLVFDNCEYCTKYTPNKKSSLKWLTVRIFPFLPRPILFLKAYFGCATPAAL